MSNRSQADYIAFRRKRRWNKPRTPQQHRGTAQEFIDNAERGARKLGSIRPVEFWGRQAYAKAMLGYIADPRMLYRAWFSLKGEAHGIDGIHPEDIGRYIMYREWREKCRLFGPKAPTYAETVFPHLGDLDLYIFHCSLDPERRFRAQHIEFDWREEENRHPGDLWKAPMFRETLEKLKAMRSGFFAMLPADARTRSIQDVERRLIGKTRKWTTPMRLPLPGVNNFNEEERERYRLLLSSTGLGEVTMDKLAQAFLNGIGKLLDLEHDYHAKSFITDITPLRYMMNYSNAKDEEEQKHALDAMRKAVNWEAMRWIGGLLEKSMANDKGYRPQPLRRVEIPKTDGGIRTLSLPTAVDRIASKSALMVIQPMMEEVFLPCSVGCRFDKDRFDALAALADRYPSSPGKIILVADIQKAFDNVPHDRMMEVVEKYIPNKNTRTLLERIIRRPGFESGVGLAQGDPLSPLFLNMLLHEHLDAPIDEYMKAHGLVYFRYVDDLSVFGLTSREHGEEITGIIDERLQHIGLSLHTKAPKTQIVDLAQASAEYYVESDTTGVPEIDRYLGLGLRGGADGTLEFFLPSSWKERISDMYVRAERKISLESYAGKPGAYTHIFNATESWIQAFAPALRYEDKTVITEQIITICGKASNHPIAEPKALHEAWDKAQKWWTRKCSEVPADVHEKK